MAKKMTIEDFAGMTAKGFDGVQGQIGEVKSEMKKGFDRIENLFCAIT